MTHPGNLKKQTIYNFIFSYFGLFIALFNTFFKTSVLTAEEIGVISLILSISGIAKYFILFGTPNVLLKFLPKYAKKEQSGIIIFLLIINTILFAIVLLALIFFKNVIIVKYNNQLFNQFYYFIILYSFISSFFQFIDLMLRTYFKSVFPGFISGFAFKISHLLVLIILFIFNYEFKIYIYSFFFLHLVSLVIVLVYLFYSVEFTKPGFGFIKNKEYKNFITYSVFVFSSGLAGTIVTQIDKIMIGIYSSLEFTGIYSIAVAIGSIIGLMGTVFSRITHPKISRDFAKNDLKTIERDYKSVGELQFFLSIFVFVLLVFFGQEVLGILGREYAQAYWVVLIISFSQVINLATSSCGGIISLSKYYKFDLYNRLLLLVLNIIMNMWLIPLFGINGAAIATAVSLILYNFLKVVFVYRKFIMHPFSGNYVKIIVSILLSGSLLYIYKLLILEINIYMIFVTSIVMFGLYYAVLLLVKFNNDYFVDINKKIKSILCLKK